MEKILLPREELKKIERKAKSLMLTREIPQGKVDIVRSIMANTKLLEEERYKAIIELLQNLPEKKPEPQRSPRRIINTEQTPHNASNTVVSSGTAYAGPTVSSLYVQDLFLRHKAKGIFKKRWLINARNRFGIGFKKRLIPSKKLIKLMRELSGQQEKIITRLPLIMNMILEDPSAEDPAVFNYLRILHRWLMDTPFASSDFETLKWMDQRHFESELKSFCIQYFSFRSLDTGTRENIILAVETRLRDMEDLKKEAVHQIDPGSIRAEKEKRNLEREKIIYDYMMTLRSFLPSIDPSEGTTSQMLKARYDISSIEECILIMMQCLVFQRDIKQAELMRYYSIKEPKISQTDWDYSADYIKKIGKDAESKRAKYYEKMTAVLDELDERYQLVNMRYDTVDFVQKSFDEQWKLVNKRRQDPGDIYDKDFFTFIDECLDLFMRGYLVLLNGSTIAFETPDKSRIESSIFSKGFFESEISTLVNLQTDLLAIKTDKPNIIISRAEAKRIVSGQIPSLSSIESYLKQLSSTFYLLGKNLQHVIKDHRDWKASHPNDDSACCRQPIQKADTFQENGLTPQPIPFFDCRLAAVDNPHPVYKNLVGHQILSSSVKDGILNTINAFCYQFAYECFDRNLLSDIEYRKELQRKMEGAGTQ